MTKKEAKKIGRPPKIDSIILGKLESAFKIGANDREACFYADINPDTLYEYQKKHPEFTEQKEIWKRNPILKAKHTIYNNLGDPKVAQWLLERKDDEYSNKIQNKITGDVSVTPTTFNILPVRASDEL